MSLENLALTPEEVYSLGLKIIARDEELNYIAPRHMYYNGVDLVEMIAPRSHSNTYYVTKHWKGVSEGVQLKIPFPEYVQEWNTKHNKEYQNVTKTTY